MKISFRKWLSLQEAAERHSNDNAAGRWTKWRSLETEPDCSTPAVYQVRLARAGVAVPLPRLLGTDRQGLLLIGATGNMDERHRSNKVAMASGEGSSPSSLLHQLERFSDLHRRFPRSAYQYRFRRQGKKAADEAESRLIKRYTCRFGDRPPLNAAIPDRGEGWQAAAEDSQK
jgi:hypothetical protein